LNSGHYAVLGLVGSSGLTEPTPAMLHGIRDAIEWLRRDGDAGSEIKGHKDGYSTSCPGGPLYAWVKKGAPRPGGAAEGEDDVSAKDVWDYGIDPDDTPGGTKWRAESLLRSIRLRVVNIETKLDAQAATIDRLVDALGAAQPDLDALKVEIREAIENVSVRLDVADEPPKE
jgi:hypothetical protein